MKPRFYGRTFADVSVTTEASWKARILWLGRARTTSTNAASVMALQKLVGTTVVARLMPPKWQFYSVYEWIRA